MACCERLRINGVLTHETGCTEAWRDHLHECAWCGSEFKPEERFQRCCDHSCSVAYAGESCDCSECTEDFGYLNELVNEVQE